MRLVIMNVKWDHCTLSLCLATFRCVEAGMVLTEPSSVDETRKSRAWDLKWVRRGVRTLRGGRKMAIRQIEFLVTTKPFSSWSTSWKRRRWGRWLRSGAWHRAKGALGSLVMSGFRVWPWRWEVEIDHLFCSPLHPYSRKILYLSPMCIQVYWNLLWT